VLAVPRSMARSLENIPNSQSKITEDSFAHMCCDENRALFHAGLSF
jgi:hypothetical protein